MPKTLHRALSVAAIATLALAACGGDDDSGGDGGDGGGETADGTIQVQTQDSLSFDPDSLEAPAGEITFELVNDGSLPHTFVIEGHEDDMKLSVGETDTGSITLEEGEYVFYCDVAGHRGGGMEGTLSVGPPAP